MNVQEFKYEFNLLYNNVMSNMAPGLDDFEISMFLTQAQEEIVTQLYYGDGMFSGFEGNEKVRRNLANLINTTNINTTGSSAYGNGYRKYPISLASTILVLISERAEIQDMDCCSNPKWVGVTPIKYDDINRVIENPFRRPDNYKVLRLDNSTTEVSLISKAILNKYEYTWLKKPAPIVVSDLPAGFSVNGISVAQPSALDESLHRTIIKYAVQLAAASWASNNKN